MNNRIKTLSILIILVGIVSACETNSPISPEKDDDGQKNKDEKAEHLGANFNTRLSAQFVRFSELERSGAMWVRGNMPFIHLYNRYKAGKIWYSGRRILGYKKFQQNWYKTALNIRIKFKAHNLSIPEKGTTRFNHYMQFLDVFLKVVLPWTDVIITGNEPIFGAPKGAKHSQRLVDFYEAVAKHTHAYIVEHNLDIPIFTGAFVNPYKSKRENNWVFNELLAFAKRTDWIQGVDMHIHHAYNKEIYKSMDYISSRLREDQRIIISEFSLVSWWGNHRRDELSADFKATYSQSVPDSVKKVWQYLNFALQHPRPIEEWNDWNRMTPWLYNRRHYICHSWHIFNSYDKFWLAFYSFKLGWRRSFKPTDAAWILNSLLVNRTVEHKPNGDAYPRIWYMADYKAIQAGEPTSCDK